MDSVEMCSVTVGEEHKARMYCHICERWFCQDHYTKTHEGVCPEWTDETAETVTQ